MSVRPIRLLGDPVLRAMAPAVDVFGAELEALVADLVDTMTAHRGLGLSAPQIGVSRRVAVVAGPLFASVPGPPIILVNPEIVDWSHRETAMESCLSIPGTRASVRRARTVWIRTWNRQGEPRFETPLARVFQGLIARAIQHEIDHLNGVLIIDRSSKLRLQKVHASEAP